MTASAGKTSLIQAALFPKLKQEGFHLFPIMRVNLEPPAKDLTGLNRYILSALLESNNRAQIYRRADRWQRACV